MKKILKEYMEHPTRTLLKVAGWLEERVNVDVLIGILCVVGLYVAFWKW